LKRMFGYLAAIIAVVAATGIVVYQSSAPAASVQVNDQIQLDLINIVLDDGTGVPGTLEITLGIIKAALSDHNYQIDSFFGVVYASNIGSMGDDGVSF